MLRAKNTNCLSVSGISTPVSSESWQVDKVSLKSYPPNLPNFLKEFGQHLNGEIYEVTSTLLGQTSNTEKFLNCLFLKKSFNKNHKGGRNPGSLSFFIPSIKTE